MTRKRQILKSCLKKYGKRMMLICAISVVSAYIIGCIIINVIALAKGLRVTIFDINVLIGAIIGAGITCIAAFIGFYMFDLRETKQFEKNNTSGEED